MSNNNNVSASYNKETINLKPSLGEGFTLVSETTSIPLFYRFDGHSLPGVSLFKNRETVQQKANEMNHLKFTCRVEVVPDLFRFCVWAFCCAYCEQIFVFDSVEDLILVKCEDIFGLDHLAPRNHDLFAWQTVHFAASYMQDCAAGSEEYNFGCPEDGTTDCFLTEKFHIPLEYDWPDKLKYTRKNSEILKFAPLIEEKVDDRTIRMLPVYTDEHSFRIDYPDETKWRFRLFQGKELVGELPRGCNYVVINPNNIHCVIEENWLRKTKKELDELMGIAPSKSKKTIKSTLFEKAIDAMSLPVKFNPK